MCAVEPDNRPFTFLHSPGAVEDVLSGMRVLQSAFRRAPQRTAVRGTVITSSGMPEPPIFYIYRGMAYSSKLLVNGQRAISDLFLMGDIVGVENAVAGRAALEITAADSFAYSFLTPEQMRELMANHQVALAVTALAAEERRRRDQHIVALTRFDAQARIAAVLVGIYDRLRQHELLTRPTFTLPLTQEQIADHVGLTMVHVNRTLRRLRQEHIAIVDRQVVIVTDLVRLRRVAHGGGQSVDGLPSHEAIAASEKSADSHLLP